MKTIIKITEKEAIDAFKESQGWSNDKEITVEIERNFFTYTPSMPIANQCLVCGEYTGNTVHNCKGYKITC